MSLISGIVHQIDDGIVRTGRSIGKPYKNIILTTGNKLTAFDLSFIAGVEVGKEYTFPIEQSGQYVNIVGAVTPVIQTGTESPDSGLPTFGAKPAEQVLPKAHTPADERGFKNRISAVSSAVEFIKDSEMRDVEQVIAVATVFLKFIEGE